jgi:farnesyl-diphosphate farnesyltransferase
MIRVALRGGPAGKAPILRASRPGHGSWERRGDDERFQDAILPGVSRTFALTIPQLPGDLRVAVANAYLLCRIADTIEDDPELTPATKDRYHRALLDALSSGRDAERFASSLALRLSPATLPAERELVAGSHRVIRMTHRLAPRHRAAIRECLEVMSTGMGQYERHRSTDGLGDLPDLERYCYFVAGVVGEMLTELFCDYSPEIALERRRLMAVAAQFGQGLQMTNILKDVWEDLERGTCWLPRDVFASAGFDLARLGDAPPDAAFAAGMRQLVAVAHRSLREALRYTLSIPRHEVGIRRFLAWSIGLAVLTLQNIDHNPRFTRGEEVKVPRRAVAGLISATNAVIRSNAALAALFNVTARGLPLPAADLPRRAAGHAAWLSEHPHHEQGWRGGIQ